MRWEFPFVTENEFNIEERRFGAIGVAVKDDKFLVIQRAEHIRAGGKYCFPGGTIEEGETPKETVVRELREELGIEVEPVREIWTSLTYWNVHLTFWHVQLLTGSKMKMDPNEVQWAGWLTIQEMLANPKMLRSNNGILSALESGELKLS